MVSCAPGEDTSRALVKHRGVNLMVLLGQSANLAIVEDASFSAGVWQMLSGVPEEEIVRHVTRRKRVWMAVGDGLAN